MYVIQGVCAWIMRIYSSGKCADRFLSRQQGNDDTSPVESQPFFEDEDSAAWASFSSNVAIACESLSNVPVRIFKDLFSYVSCYFSYETSSQAKNRFTTPISLMKLVLVPKNSHVEDRIS